MAEDKGAIDTFMSFFQPIKPRGQMSHEVPKKDIDAEISRLKALSQAQNLTEEEQAKLDALLAKKASAE